MKQLTFKRIILLYAYIKPAAAVVHNIKDISIIVEARPAEPRLVVFLSYNYLLLFDLSFSHALTKTAQWRKPRAILFLIKTRGQKQKIKIK